MIHEYDAVIVGGGPKKLRSPKPYLIPRKRYFRSNTLRRNKEAN